MPFCSLPAAASGSDSVTASSRVPCDTVEAFDYYRTDRGQAENGCTTFEVDGASHYDLYHRPSGAGEALKTVIPFFDDKL